MEAALYLDKLLELEKQKITQILWWAEYTWL